MFLRDRSDAAERLVERLRPYAGRHPLVLAIPRGAVPMARTLADALGADLDVLLVTKLGAPDDPERAIGSVDERGEVVLEPSARSMGYTDAWLERERAHRLDVLAHRARLYRGGGAPPEPRGRTVIVVDDGAATGATLMGALRLLQGHGPERVVVALAVAPRRVVRRLRGLADAVVCLYQPWLFVSVNQVFRRFESVDDATVQACLARASP